eukprot:3636666-Pleurochrysis_carterae.AAC.1
MDGKAAREDRAEGRRDMPHAQTPIRAHSKEHVPIRAGSARSCPLHNSQAHFSSSTRSTPHQTVEAPTR